MLLILQAMSSRTEVHLEFFGPQMYPQFEICPTQHPGIKQGENGEISCQKYINVVLISLIGIMRPLVMNL